MAKIEIPIPPLNEQRRIAGILDKADAIRRKREQALGLVDDFLRSAFLDMFGDPRINPKAFPTPPLEEQADILVGNPFPSAQYGKEGIRVCRGANVLPQRLDWDDVRFWSADDINRFKRFLLAEGDVILALDRPWISTGLKVARVTSADVPALLVQRVARIRSDSNLANAFIYYAMRHRSFTQYCRPTETTIPHISPVELREFPLIAPPTAALEKFGKLVCEVEKIWKANLETTSASDQLFASLSQRAFRGEL